MKNRFFVLKQNIKNNKILLESEEHYHLSKVLRLKPFDIVECFFDGSDVYMCQITTITKNSSVLEILKSRPCNENPKTDITLFQGLPKLDKLEIITQKLCEIGISKIAMFSSSFCVAKSNPNKIERLKKIAVSACKQCGRTKIPVIKNTLEFFELLNKLEDYDLVIFANETEEKQNLKQAFNDFFKSNPNKNKKIAYIVGSEGGFSKEEIDSIKKQSNVKSVTLGKRILRTETASIVLGALICHYLGEV